MNLGEDAANYVRGDFPRRVSVLRVFPGTRAGTRRFTYNGLRYNRSLAISLALCTEISQDSRTVWIFVTRRTRI